VSIKDIAEEICQANNLTFVEKVGSGAFKDTYHVIDANMVHLALKVFRPGHSPKRSEREIEAMIKCNHPNIGKLVHVSHFDTGDQSILFLLEEYLSGGTLTDKINRTLFTEKETETVGRIRLLLLLWILA
jgi:serine/threonine protein kinase